MNKIFKICMSMIIVFAMFVMPSKIDAESEKTNQSEMIFSSDYLDGDLKVEETENGDMYIQDFKQVEELPMTRTLDSRKVYKLTAGREILTEDEYVERQSEIKTRATLTDSYNDGRGTHLYVEIVYSVSVINGDNSAKYISLYCNSSGSTLSSYSVTYGVEGVNMLTKKAFSARKTENVDLVMKTFSKNIEKTYNWPPLYFGPGNDMLMGVTQKYNCRGYSKSWTVNV